MKSLIVVAVLLFLATSGSFALKCYTCTKLGSSSCETNSKTCNKDQDRCAKALIKIDGKTSVNAQCTTADECKNITKTCELVKKLNPKITDCDGYCCSSDDCNGSPAFQITTFAPSELPPSSPVTSALKCYTCTKVGSSSCETGSKTCDKNQDRCGKNVVKIDNKTMVNAECTTADKCKNIKKSCDLAKKLNPKITDCDGYCCSSDNCNGSPKPPSTTSASPKSTSVTLAVLVMSVFVAILLK